MIIGVGTDLVDMNRIGDLLKKQAAFPQRILTPGERDLFAQLSPQEQVTFLAGRWASKEALAKAMGTGIGKEFSFQDVSILNRASGQPYVQVESHKFTGMSFHLSISHDGPWALAFALIEGREEDEHGHWTPS